MARPIRGELGYLVVAVVADSLQSALRRDSGLS